MDGAAGRAGEYFMDSAIKWVGGGHLFDKESNERKRWKRTVDTERKGIKRGHPLILPQAGPPGTPKTQGQKRRSTIALPGENGVFAQTIT